MAKGKQKVLYFNNAAAAIARRKTMGNKLKQKAFEEYMKTYAPFRPVGEYVLVEKNTSKRVGLIEIPETATINLNNEIQVIRVSKKITELYPNVILPGTVLLHTAGSRTKNVIKERLPSGRIIELQFVHINDIGALVTKQSIIPLGRKVRVRRLTEEFKMASGIVIPGAQPTRDQSKEGLVMGTGILSTKDKDWVNEYRPYCLVRWKSWSENHIEVLVKNQYDLIIPEDDIVYIDYGFKVDLDTIGLEKAK
jgi:co-chaperonin GroES (HSP10)